MVSLISFCASERVFHFIKKKYCSVSAQESVYRDLLSASFLFLAQNIENVRLTHDQRKKFDFRRKTRAHQTGLQRMDL